MAEDWDPFADPAGTIEADATLEPRPQVKQEMGRSTDIVAALRAPLREPATMTAETFNSLLDDFFCVAGDDVDFAVIEDAFGPVARAIRENSDFKVQLWRRGLPIVSKVAQPKRTERTLNVFGLMVEDFFGFKMDLDDNWPANTVCDQPCSGEACGRVIFLLGWGGGACSDMDDMVALYQEIFPGAVIIRLECCSSESWGLRVECAHAIRAAAKTWTTMNAEATPQLLVHLFSNGGFFTWTEMLKSWHVLSERDEELPELGMPWPRMSAVLRGIILDSSPDATPDFRDQCQSLAQTMAPFISRIVANSHDGSEEGKKEAEGKSRRTVLEIIGTNSPVNAYLEQKPGGERMVLDMCSARTKSVHQLEPPVPTQFIYSVADKIIRYQGIEEYMSEVEKRPNREGLPPPRRLRFDKTRHVLHKVEKRDEYMSCVKAFAVEVLSSENGSTK